jgi:hypothetical protein
MMWLQSQGPSSQTGSMWRPVTLDPLKTAGHILTPRLKFSLCLLWPPRGSPYDLHNWADGSPRRLSRGLVLNAFGIGPSLERRTRRKESRKEEQSSGLRAAPCASGHLHHSKTSMGAAAPQEGRDAVLSASPRLVCPLLFCSDV